MITIWQLGSLIKSKSLVLHGKLLELEIPAVWSRDPRSTCIDRLESSMFHFFTESDRFSS